MAVEKFNIQPVVTLASTALNSLTLNTYTLDSTVHDNTAGITNFEGSPYAMFELVTAALGTSFQGTPVFEVWLIPAIDGTNYEDTGTFSPRRAADVTFYLRPATSAQRVVGIRGTTTDRENFLIPLPPGKFKVLHRVYHPEGGGPSTLAASGNTLKLRAHSLQSV